MNQKHTHQSVQARIAELVEDVKKLEFGCQVEYELYPLRGILKSRVVDYQPQEKIYWLDGGIIIHRVEESEIKKVIGRDATLADVLRAIHKSHTHNKTIIRIEEDGEVFKYLGYDVGWWSAGIIWNLSLPLSGQSQETIDFIGNLIK